MEGPSEGGDAWRGPPGGEAHAGLLQELLGAEDALAGAQEKLRGARVRLAGSAEGTEAAALREENLRLRRELEGLGLHGPEPRWSLDGARQWGTGTAPLPGVVVAGLKEAAGGGSEAVSCQRAGTALRLTAWGSDMSPESSASHDPAYDLKSRIQKALLVKEAYNVADFYHTAGLWQAVARSARFEQVTLAVIALNALWIAIDTDYNHSEVLLTAEPIFQIAEHAFCIYFSFEWLARFLAFRRKLQALRDGWFLFDSLLVFLMVFETWVMNAIIAASSLGSAPKTAGRGASLRILRLLRLTRMARMARLFRAVPELLVMIKGIVAASRSVLVTLGVLTLILYVFAVTFTQLLRGSVPGQAYFGGVADAMISLVYYGIFMDGITNVLGEVGRENILCGGLFLLFILFASFTVLNMLIGVICEAVHIVSTTENEIMTIQHAKETLLHMLRTTDLDEDQNERISRVEFASLLEIPAAAIVLQNLGVDAVGLVDMMDVIFDNQEELDFPTFMNTVIQLRGSNMATVQDIVMLRRFMQQELAKLCDLLPAAPSCGGATTKSTKHSGVHYVPVFRSTAKRS